MAKLQALLAKGTASPSRQPAHAATYSCSCSRAITPIDLITQADPLFRTCACTGLRLSWSKPCRCCCEVLSTFRVEEICPRCDIQLLLLESNHPDRSDYPGCPSFPGGCACTGIRLSWSKPCSFCCEVLSTFRVQQIVSMGSTSQQTLRGLPQFRRMPAQVEPSRKNGQPG